MNTTVYNGRETDCLSTQPSICLARAQLIISNQARLRRPSARDSITSRYRVQYEHRAPRENRRGMHVNDLK